ncbi:MAG TPA: hypothetical protein VN662_08775 [Rhodanobacteraceae bacterium]|nr:hypothetical protein [Rhodanobacteraceae bacterium]
MNTAPFRISDLGPADDHDAMAFDAARDEVLDDEDVCDEIAAKVRAEFDQEINEICSGAWSVEGAQKIAARMCAAAEREIDKHARDKVAGWAESRALANVED